MPSKGDHCKETRENKCCVRLPQIRTENGAKTFNELLLTATMSENVFGFREIINNIYLSDFNMLMNNIKLHFKHAIVIYSCFILKHPSFYRTKNEVFILLKNSFFTLHTSSLPFCMISYNILYIYFVL